LLATRNRECTGVDPLWESSLENVVKNGRSDERHPEYIQAAGERLPLKAQRYDVILCISTLQHVNNQISTLHEIRRVAKPGATVIFSVPQTFRKSTFNKLGLYTMHFNVKSLKNYWRKRIFISLKFPGVVFLCR
jgi:ubiquinone/menaquinone biosynthesis C-methylase UbiE